MLRAAAAAAADDAAEDGYTEMDGGCMHAGRGGDDDGHNYDGDSGDDDMTAAKLSEEADSYMQSLDSRIHKCISLPWSNNDEAPVNITGKRVLYHRHAYLQQNASTKTNNLYKRTWYRPTANEVTSEDQAKRGYIKPDEERVSR